MSVKIKKLNLKIKYLNLELQEVKDISHVANAEWGNYLYHLEKQHDITIIKKSEKSCDRSCGLNKKQQKKHNKNNDKLFKELYHNIARVAHPDVTGDDDQMTKLMKHATQANEDHDLIEMLDVHESLGLESPELSDDHIKIIEDNIKQKEQQIKTIKSQDAWTWYHADPTQRQQIEQMILKSVGKIN